MASSGFTNIPVLSAYTKTPSIASPKIATDWYSAYSDITLYWNYNGSDMQEIFTIEMQRYNITTGANLGSVITIEEFYANQYYSVADYISIDGYYKWRVRVRGHQRSYYSDWSEYGYFKVDITVPVINDIDLTYNIGNSADLWESHTNTKEAALLTSSSDTLGVYVSRDPGHGGVVVKWQGDGTSAYTFAMKIKLPGDNNINYRIMRLNSNGKPVVDCDIFTSSSEKNAVWLTSTIKSNEYQGINILTSENNSRITFNMYYWNGNKKINTSDRNWINSGGSPVFPTDLSEKNTDMGDLVYIGKAKANPSTFYEVTGLFRMQVLNYDKIASVSSSMSNSNVVSSILDGNSFITSLDLTNVIAGDYVKFMNTYDSYLQDPQNPNPFVSESIGDLYQYMFEVSSEPAVINAQSNSIELLNYDTTFTNINRSSVTLTSLTTNITYDSDSETTTLLNDAGSFNTIVLPSSNASAQVGENGLTNRKITITTADGSTNYRIIGNSNGSLTISGEVDVANPLTDGDGTEYITYVINGDEFVAYAVFPIVTTSTLNLYINASDSMSGIKYVKVIEKDPLSSGTFSRVEPTASDISSATKQLYTEGMEITLSNDEGLIDVYVYAYDGADNISATPASLLLEYKTLSNAVVDFTMPAGSLVIDDGDKATTSSFVRINASSITDAQTDIDEMRFSNTANKYYTTPEPPANYKSWRLGHIFKGKITGGATIGSSSGISKVSPEGDISTSGTSVYESFTFRNDLIGKLIKFNTGTADSPVYTSEYPVVDVADNGDIYVQADLTDVIKENVLYEINTMRTYPNGTFSTGGVFASFINIPSSEEGDVPVIDSLRSVDNYIGVTIASDISWTSGFNTSIGPNDTVIGNSPVVAILTGWVYLNFNGLYTFKISSSNGSRFYVEDSLVINDWNATATTDGTINNYRISEGVLDNNELRGRGWYQIRIEYFNTSQLGNLNLSYESPVGTTAVVATASSLSDNTFNVDATLTENQLNNYDVLTDIVSITTAVGSEKTILIEKAELDSSNDTVFTLRDSLGNDTVALVADELTGNANNVLIQPSTDKYNFYRVISNTTNTVTVDGDHRSAVSLVGSFDTCRFGRYLMKIRSNTTSSVALYPVISGTFDSAVYDSVTGYTKLTDTDSSFVGQDLTGQPLVFESNVYAIVDVGANSVFIRGDQSSATVLTYTIRSVSGFLATGDSVVLYLGQPPEVVGTDNLSRECETVYGKILNKAGLTYNTTTVVSMLGATDTDVVTSLLSGVITSYNLASDTFTTVNVGSPVHCAEELAQIVAVYTSQAYSAGDNLAYWKKLYWDQSRPTGTEVQLEVRTAPTLSELESATWNRDAWGSDWDPYVQEDYDTPADIPTGIDISGYTTDGSISSDGSISKNKYMQFRITLTTTENRVTSQVSSVTIEYSTAQSVLFFTKEFVLTDSITEGILTTNTTEPSNTDIVYGIGTSDNDSYQTDFSRYQIIPTDEAFTVQSSNNKFKIAAKLISAGSSIPELKEIAFAFTTDGAKEKLNEDL